MFASISFMSFIHLMQLKGYIPRLTIGLTFEILKLLQDDLADIASILFMTNNIKQNNIHTEKVSNQ